LHQRLKYIANERFIIIKVEQTMIVMKNIVVPYIELEGVRDGGLHTFKVVNTYLFIENTINRSPALLKVVKIAIKYMVK
jgi:hypothetical protein